MLLYRPVGTIELGLIYDSQFTAYPPRLPAQPFFYPVLNSSYAEQIAGEWNTKNAGAGYVTTFEVEDKYLRRYVIKKVGGKEHLEYWIPAEKLEKFNKHIIDTITVTSAFFSKDYKGFVPERFGFKDKNAKEQFLILHGSLHYSGMDFSCEIAANHKTTYLNYPFWTLMDYYEEGIDDKEKDNVLKEVKWSWNKNAENRLPYPLIDNAYLIK